MIGTASATSATSYDLRGITPTLSTDDSHVGLDPVQGRHRVAGGGCTPGIKLPLNKPIYTAFDVYMKRR